MLIGVVWPLVAWPRTMLLNRLHAAWAALCLATAVFPLLSVHKEESVPTMCVLFPSLSLSLSLYLSASLDPPPCFVDVVTDVGVQTNSLAGGLGMLLAGLLGALSHDASASPHRLRITTALAAQCTLVLLSMLVTARSAASLRAKRGLPLLNQVAGWVILGAQSSSSTRICCGY